MPRRATRQFGWCATVGLACCQLVGLALAAEPETPVDFARDVRPILAARCFECHGADLQESDLRLDVQANALAGGAGGAVIVPGKGAESQLVKRISSSDPDLRMPPEGHRLSPAEINAIKSWIDQGAAWAADSSAADASSAARPTHWSLRPLARPKIPGVAGTIIPANPIDAFVAAKLAEHGLEPSAEADRRTLIRRVTIDLTGLQPTPEDLAHYLSDSEPGAYERLVDRLLASPRYGERWARHWMDVVHFAETHGNDQDRPRPHAWPYRDYLIRSFNDDKPYARFVAEQVAGDVLYPADSQATVALGFLAAGSWDESSLMCIVDDTIDKKLAQLLDRDDMITNCMSTFISTTVHCARCHNHKFDPIPQAEYYALQAVFAGVDRADRSYDPDPAVHRQRRDLQARRRELLSLADAALVANSELTRRTAEVEAQFSSVNDAWTVIVPSDVAAAQETTTAVQSDGSVLFAGARPEKDNYSFALSSDLETITAVRLEVLADPSLPRGGPGRQDNGNLHLTEFGVSVAPEAGGEATPVALSSAFADFDQDGWSIGAAIDGKPDTAWGIHPQEGKSHTAVFLFAKPLTSAGPKRLTVVLEQQHGRGHLIGRVRLSLTAAANPTMLRPLPDALASALAVPPTSRSTEQQAAVVRQLSLWRLDDELAALPPQQVVYAAASEFKGGNNFRPAGMPRPVHVLRRGDINQPLAEAAPGALSCVSTVEAKFAVPEPANEGSRRAALAQWLIDSQHTLTWRSIVNRVWHYHFDRGIVDTPNDLGEMGGQPSHPELLDWLAVEFRDRGGSLKELHRLIVTSATYRQSSQSDARAASIDADNRLLWRMNRRRLDAETIRDTVLQTSGKLDLTMGGPSVKQFVESPGIHVTPVVDYQTFDIDAPGQYRRSVYRFLFRTLPDPFMETLDCPDGAQLAPTRSASVTALQALSMLDNRFIVRQSEHAALRFTQLAPTLPDQVRLMFEWVLLRPPSEQESRKWEQYAARHGLANACRMLLNTNEFVFVN